MHTLSVLRWWWNQEYVIFHWIKIDDVTQSSTNICELEKAEIRVNYSELITQYQRSLLDLCIYYIFQHFKVDRKPDIIKHLCRLSQQKHIDFFFAFRQLSTHIFYFFDALVKVRFILMTF